MIILENKSVIVTSELNECTVTDDILQPVDPNYIEVGFIEFKYLRATLTNYERNAFTQFLCHLFPEDIDLVQEAVKNYFIGTTREGKTVFWQIDQRRKIRTGKVLAYNSLTGKRNKDIAPTWAHAELKKGGLLKQDFNLKQCFFGEHLLQRFPNAPVAIVEAEKTAVISSLCFPEFVWLAIGAKKNLKTERLLNFRHRTIVLYPDADGFSDWMEVGRYARRRGLSVSVSTLIEERATPEQKANGYDLADVLIDEQSRINAHNKLVDQQPSIIQNDPLITSVESDSISHYHYH